MVMGLHNLDTGETYCFDCLGIDMVEAERRFLSDESLIILTPTLRDEDSGLFVYGEACLRCGAVIYEPTEEE